MTQKMTIWKFNLRPMDRQQLNLPVGATILSVQTQREIPQLWALVDANEPRVRVRTITCYGTGAALPDDPGTYLGTCQLDQGRFIAHVFEDML